MGKWDFCVRMAIKVNRKIVKERNILWDEGFQKIDVVERYLSINGD